MEQKTEDADVPPTLEFFQIAERVDGDRRDQERQGKIEKAGQSIVGKAVCKSGTPDEIDHLTGVA